MKNKALLCSSLTLILLVNTIQGQNADVDARVGKITRNVAVVDSNTFEIVSNLFSSIQQAVSITDSLSASIDSTESSDTQTADKIIEILSEKVLPIYHSVNQNKTKYRKVMENFREVVFEDGYTVNDLIDNKHHDLTRQKNELNRLGEITPRSEEIGIKIRGQEMILSQLNAQIEYLKEFQKELDKIRNFSSTTERDISVFLASAEMNELVIQYVLQTLKLRKRVEEFLKVAKSLASIKEISQNMLKSVKELNESVRSLLERRTSQLKQEGTTRSPEEAKTKPPR